mgnify:CR=1 FL=1
MIVWFFQNFLLNLDIFVHLVKFDNLFVHLLDSIEVLTLIGHIFKLSEVDLSETAGAKSGDQLEIWEIYLERIKLFSSKTWSSGWLGHSFLGNYIYGDSLIGMSLCFWIIGSFLFIFVCRIFITKKERLKGVWLCLCLEDLLKFDLFFFDRDFFVR